MLFFFLKVVVLDHELSWVSFILDFYFFVFSVFDGIFQLFFLVIGFHGFMVFFFLLFDFGFELWVLGRWVFMGLFVSS